MCIILNILLTLIGFLILLLGIASLINIKKLKESKTTYGGGLDKNIIESGINIHHGMVIKNNKLVATMKKV